MVLYELELNNDIQDEVIGLSKNDQNMLINQKILAFHEVLPPQLVEVNTVVSSLDVRDVDGCPTGPNRSPALPSAGMPASFAIS